MWWDTKKTAFFLSVPALFHTKQHEKQHEGKSFTVLLTEVLISNYHPDKIIFQILQWWEMHKDPSRNLAQNRAMENFSFMRSGWCDSATCLCGRNSLVRTNFSSILKFAEICIIWKLLFPRETLLEEMSKLPAEWWGLSRCSETAGCAKTQFAVK